MPLCDGLKAVALPLSDFSIRKKLESNQRVINDVAVSILKLVATDNFEMSTYRLSSDYSASELRGCKFVPGRCSSDDRLDIISRPLFGGKGEIRTHTGHRMKVLHNHYATLPYRNTLGYLPIYLGILFRKMCFYMVGAQGIEP